jgi:hypothetical protein
MQVKRSRQGNSKKKASSGDETTSIKPKKGKVQACYQLNEKLCQEESKQEQKTEENSLIPSDDLDSQ